jgi:hypothetical protein
MVRAHYIVVEKCQGREPSGIVGSSTGCEDQILQLGVQEGGEKERRRERICWPRAKIITVSFILIYHKHSSMDVALERG